jgi:hypothetical protein
LKLSIKAFCVGLPRSCSAALRGAAVHGRYAGVDIDHSNETGASVALGYEPAPLHAVARLDSYPWLVVGTVCIGAFMGQVDASIAQLVLSQT